jgi:hypothetical protein
MTPSEDTVVRPSAGPPCCATSASRAEVPDPEIADREVVTTRMQVGPA